MPLKIYRGGTLNEEGERDQLSQLLEIISNNFDDRHANVYLVVDPKFPVGSYPQIDSLFYREGRIVILELKNIKGKFKPATGSDESWTAINADGTERIIGKQYKNPFFQVDSQRSFLISYFAKNIRKQNVNKYKSLGKEIGDKIGGWIVTARDSEPTLNKHPELFWSKVVPLDNVIKELSHIGTRDDDAITEDEFKKLLKQTNCIETNKRDTFLTGVVPKFESGWSPVIEDMIASEKPEEIRKSIKYCRELSFINYFDNYNMIAPSLPKSVRGEVYSLLFEWLIEFPEKFNRGDARKISENGIKDEDHQIREQTLNFLLSSPYGIDTNIADDLESGLQNENFLSNVQLFVEAFCQINDKNKASRVLKSFYEEHLKEQFFHCALKFRNLNDQLLPSDKVSFKRNNREEYKGAMEKSSSYTKVVKTWLEAASEISSKELQECCLLHLREVLGRLQIDFESEYDVADTLEETITSLGTMKYSEAADDLLEIMSKFKSIRVKLTVIEALGQIGNVKVIPELRKYLFGNGEYDPHDAKLLKGQASIALARLGDSESFDTIWNDFALESCSDSKEKFYSKILFESLKTMDVKKLENMLWNEVENRNYSQQSFSFFADFIKECASSYTFEKCKELVLDPKFFSYDVYCSPGGILKYAVWKYDDLKKKGEKLGLEFLKMENLGLQEIGLSIAESYFLQNPDKLPDYENIESEEAQGIIREIYVKLKRQDKIEMFFQKSKEKDRRHLFYCLERIIPEMHFEFYSVVKNHRVIDSEFIVGSLGIYLKTNEINDGIVYNHDYKNISWKSITYMKKLKFDKRTIGLVFGYEDGGNIDITLISDSAMEWDYLKGHRTNESPGLNKLFENFEKTKEGSEKPEVCFESADLFKDIEAVFTNLPTHYGLEEDKNNIIAKFESEFNPENVSIE